MPAVLVAVPWAVIPLHNQGRFFLQLKFTDHLHDQELTTKIAN
jgi:hypothetical protein